MIVAVRDLHLIKQVAAIGGLVALHVHDVNDVFVSRVGEDVHVIPRPLPQAVAGIHEVPGFAAVVGPVEAAIGITRLDERINPIGVGRDGNADAPIRPFGQTVLFQPLPGCAPIVRAIKSAARATVGQTPGGTACLPERGKQNIRIVRIEGHVDASGILILIKNFFPGLAAIERAKNAAFGVRPVGMAEGRHKNDVWIVGIDDDFADGAGIAQANVLPGLARVERLVNAVAMRNVAADAGFARAHVNRVVV